LFVHLQNEGSDGSRGRSFKSRWSIARSDYLKPEFQRGNVIIVNIETRATPKASISRRRPRVHKPLKSLICETSDHGDTYNFVEIGEELKRVAYENCFTKYFKGVLEDVNFRSSRFASAIISLEKDTIQNHIH